MSSLADTITRWGVVEFPGSNCDHDALDTLDRICGQAVRPVWHGETCMGDMDAIVLPGGFSYGDYLRGGAIARFANVMDQLIGFAERGGLLIGICNGFQVLTEAELLPGVLMRNSGLRFVCKEVYLKVERTDTAFTSHYEQDQVIKIPIAHNEGNFYIPSDQLDELEKNRQVVFRYCDSTGAVTPESNPNGSHSNIAGIVNKRGNILGMMPHPERRCDSLLGQADGLSLFHSMINHLSGN